MCTFIQPILMHMKVNLIIFFVVVFFADNEPKRGDCKNAAFSDKVSVVPVFQVAGCFYLYF